MSNTEALRAALQAAREARDAIPLGAERSALNVALDRLDVALSAAAALAQPAASGEPLSGKWEGGEEWMPLAWELCADECGEEACTELVWEGGPVPEPWGDRWLKYEDEAKRLIALVRKHAPAAQPAPALVPLTEAQIKTMKEAAADQGLTGIAPSLHLARAVEAWHGIPAAPTAQQEPAP